MASPDRRRRRLEEEEEEARRTAASTSSGAAGQGEQPQQPRQQHQQQQQPQQPQQLQQQPLEQELAVQASRLVDSFSQAERQAMMAALLRQQPEPAGQPAAGRGTESVVGTSAGIVHGTKSATWPPQGLSAPYAPPGLGALGSTMGGSTTEPNGDSGFVSQARADQSASGSYVFGGRAGGPGGRHLLNSLTRGDRACQIRDRRGRPSQDRRDLPSRDPRGRPTKVHRAHLTQDRRGSTTNRQVQSIPGHRSSIPDSWGNPLPLRATRPSSGSGGSA